MSRKARRYNKHHLIPTSKKREGFNISAEKNIVRMRVQIHNALHSCVGNKVPKQQLRMWAELHKTVLSKKARRLLRELIDMDNRAFYDKDLIK